MGELQVTAYIVIEDGDDLEQYTIALKVSDAERNNADWPKMVGQRMGYVITRLIRDETAEQMMERVDKELQRLDKEAST